MIAGDNQNRPFGKGGADLVAQRRQRRLGGRRFAAVQEVAHQGHRIHAAAPAGVVDGPPYEFPARAAIAARRGAGRIFFGRGIVYVRDDQQSKRRCHAVWPLRVKPPVRRRWAIG